MYLTHMDLINAKITAEGKINESDIIKYIIKDDEESDNKRRMMEGEKYYAYEHDIINKDFTTSAVSETIVDETGNERQKISSFSNPNRSNHKNVNAFHRILVDQKVAYIAGNIPTISVKDAHGNKELSEYEEIITEYANEEFNQMIQELICGASNKGFETLHIYYDKSGKLCYCIVPANEIIPIYDSTYGTVLEQIIRYYDVVVIRDGKKYVRKKIEWWTKDDVTYYCQDDNDDFVQENQMEYNPSPHWWSITSIDGMVKKRMPHGWGKVPFIILKNNQKGTTDLEGIKGLIDAYDLISSEGANNLLDLVELYWVIQGYAGETAAAIAKKLQMNKAVHVSDSGGNIEAKQVEIPIDGRIKYLDMLRRDIFHFGQGIDVDMKKFGNAPSGVSLKFQYTMLDLKCNNMATKLKRVIKEFFWFFTQDYNRRFGTDYNSELIRISFKKTMITNEYETVQMIGLSKGTVSERTLLSKHPFVEDIPAEIKELEKDEPLR